MGNEDIIEKIMEECWDNLGYKIGVKKKKGKYVMSAFSIRAFSYDDWEKIIKKLTSHIK